MSAPLDTAAPDTAAESPHWAIWMANRAPIPERFQLLPLGAVKPAGWLRRQMESNLAHFTGHLDQLAPALVVHDDIYGRDRLTASTKTKELGAKGVPARDRAQFLWWNSETQSNWWDGLIRTAILLDDAPALERAAQQVSALLATQDANGYLGIYADDLRYRFTGENGELWAKATCARYLLGWYEHTRDDAVLTSVVRAIDDVMRHYPIGASHPFATDRPDTSGLTHGLAITDVLEQLWRLTGDGRYAEYLVFLYADFSAQELAEDARFETVTDDARPLRGHGVHTYEHLRSVAAAYQLTGHPELGDALSAYLRKVHTCLTPSGGPVGDEFINGSGADATSRGYEYCSLQELLHSYASLLAKTGRKDVGDTLERLFVNAAQGARHPDGSAIAYLKSDNSYAMSGPLNGDASQPTQTRYSYSPLHQDAAVCCVPNAGRIAPYYVQHMWMRDGDALVATLLGPSVVESDISGHRVRIAAETRFPADGSLHCSISGARAGLTLMIRRPSWATFVKAGTPYTERDGFLRFAIPPSEAPVELDIEFGLVLQQHRDRRGDTYFSYGACVLARALPAQEVVTRTYPVPGFADRSYTSPGATIYECPPDISITPLDAHASHFSAMLVNPHTCQREAVVLMPMGQTILRQVTFAPTSTP